MLIVLICCCCSFPPGARYLAPLDMFQLSALARLGAKKSSDRKTWLEALMATPAAAPPAGAAPVPVPGAAEPAAANTGSSSLSPLPGAGVDVCGLLGIVRGRVLPAPHLAYHTPECCYPGSQVNLILPSPGLHQYQHCSMEQLHACPVDLAMSSLLHQPTESAPVEVVPRYSHKAGLDVFMPPNHIPRR